MLLELLLPCFRGVGGESGNTPLNFIARRVAALLLDLATWGTRELSRVDV